MSQWIEIKDGSIVNLDKINDMGIEERDGKDGYKKYVICMDGEEADYIVCVTKSLQEAKRNLTRIKKSIIAGERLIFCLNYDSGEETEGER